MADLLGKTESPPERIARLRAEAAKRRELDIAQQQPPQATSTPAALKTPPQSFNLLAPTTRGQGKFITRTPGVQYIFASGKRVTFVETYISPDGIVGLYAAVSPSEATELRLMCASPNSLIRELLK